MAKVSTRKRGKTWYYSIEATEYTVDGKRRRVEKGGFATKKEAEEAGAKAQVSLARGNVAILSEKISVKDFLAEWLTKKEKELRPTTATRYRAALKAPAAFFGDKSLQKLRPRDVEALMQDLAKRGLARGTIGKTLTTLKDALSYAVFPLELIQGNPAQYIKVPKNAPAKVIERVVIRQDKLDELLTAYPFGNQLHLPIVIAYHTGMRMGEVLGLCWDCVDLSAGTITVARQLGYTTATGYYFGEPKTATSKRTIPIDGELIALLKRWKRQQAQNELECGGGYFYSYEGTKGELWQVSKVEPPEKGFVRRELVCTHGNGKRVPHDTLRAGLRQHGVNSHSLRHTHATLCAENGAPIKGLAGRLGHTNISITANLYTHETEKMQSEVLAAFEGEKISNVGKSVGKRK